MSIIKNILTIEVPVELYPPKWDIWWNNPENNREFGRLFKQRFNRAIQNYIFPHMYLRYSFDTFYRMAFYLHHEYL